MSACPIPGPSSPSLSGSEGKLVSVTVSVEPRLLERLLGALADLSFPLNPQIYHSAAVAYVYPDGRREVTPVTMVEFPAYAARLPEVREVLRRQGFDPATVHARDMLEELHSSAGAEPPPPGAPYSAVLLLKQPAP